jgi:hypothetical protein
MMELLGDIIAHGVSELIGYDVIQASKATRPNHENPRPI